MFGEIEIDHIFLNKEEQDQILLSQPRTIPLEYEEYKQGYQNAIMEVHRQYNLKSRKFVDAPPKKISDTPSKNIFDNKTKADDFYIDEKVLKWDSRREDKGKHGKIDFLWQGPYIIYGYRGNNTFLLRDLNGIDLPGGPINGRIPNPYLSTD